MPMWSTVHIEQVLQLQYLMCDLWVDDQDMPYIDRGGDLAGTLRVNLLGTDRL